MIPFTTHPKEGAAAGNPAIRLTKNRGHEIIRDYPSWKSGALTRHYQKPRKKGGALK